MGGLKRKAIQLANNTLVVSLPAKWAKQNSIEKGAELDMDVKEHMLVIGKGADSASEERKIKLDISGMNESLVWNYLNSVYRVGYDEIEIFFPQQSLKNIKTGEVKKTMDVISRITDKLIGMEIIGQSRNSCTLKEVTHMKSEEFSNILNRIFLSLRTISKDVLGAIMSRDGETLENLFRYSEINVNKLSDYCMRILNLQGLNDFKVSNVNYLIVFLLEEIGDVYAQIARDVSADPEVLLTRNVFDLFEDANVLLELSHKFLLNPKKEYYISFHERRNVLKNRIANAGKKDDPVLLSSLRSVTDKLMELCNAKVSERGGF